MKRFVLFLSLCGVICLTGCEKEQVNKYEYQQFKMDTLFQIMVYSAKPKPQVDKAVIQAFEIIGSLEKQFSATRTDSLLSRLNREKTVLVSDNEILQVFRDLTSYAKATGGAFDPTIYPIVRLWGFPDKKFRIPSDEEIARQLKKVDYHNLQPGRITYLLHQAEIDPGAMLKGTAVDRAVEFLQSRNITSGIVNAGGNLRVFGAKPDKSPWSIGIRHPRQPAQVYQVIKITNEIAIATSGDYERFFIENGIRYHHIMSSLTGKPVRNGVVSVSVIAPSAQFTDAYSTALFVMGVEKGLLFARQRNIAVQMLTEPVKGQLKAFSSPAWDKLIAQSGK